MKGLQRRDFLKTMFWGTVYLPFVSHVEYHRVMYVGDSIVSGFPHDPVSGPTMKNQLLAERPDLLSVGSQPGNTEGHLGYRTDELAALVGASCRKFNPEIVFVHAGTNDIIQGVQPSLSQLIGEIKANTNSAIIIVSRIIQMNPATNLVSQYNNQYVDSLSGVETVDLESVLTPDDYLDKYHPSAFGNYKLAVVLAEFLRSISV